jgi:hypothetical protein
VDVFREYWMEFVFALVSGYLVRSYQKIKLDYMALKTGTQAILRDRIIQIYYKFIDQDYIPIHTMESLELMYQQYKKLGGNGTATKLMDELRRLPSKDPKKGEN